jgi:hypothetical protein
VNLHNIVRGQITAVNPDGPITYIASAGNGVAAGGKMTPKWALPVLMTGQVQPISMDALQHYEFVNAQGIYRRVYVNGQQDAINRIAQLGGDLLKFPELMNVPGSPTRTWLIKAVEEQWPNWCNVIVVMQLDPANPV